MKKTLLLLVIISAMSSTARAQTDAGMTMTGFSFVYTNYTKNKIESSTYDRDYTFDLAQFIMYNFALGGGVGFRSSTYPAISKDTGLNHQVNFKGILFRPYVRYYRDLSDKLKLFAQLSCAIVISDSYPVGTKIDQETGKEVTAYDGDMAITDLAISPGIAFFPIENLGIELGINGFSFRNQNFKLGIHEPGPPPESNLKLGTNFFAPMISAKLHF